MKGGAGIVGAGGLGELAWYGQLRPSWFVINHPSDHEWNCPPATLRNFGLWDGCEVKNQTSAERDFPLGERSGSGEDERMGNAGDWELSKVLARAILYDRGQRRKWLARLMALTVAWMAAGLWVVAGWLAKSALVFALWWGFCFFLAAVLVLFALYDALAVLREERANSDERIAKFLAEQKKSHDE